MQRKIPGKWKRLRRLWELITGTELELRERLFLLLSVSAVTAVFAAFVIDIVEGENLAEILLLGVATAVAALVAFWTLRTHRLETGTLLIACGIVFVIMPATFFFGGGIRGGSILWFSFCFLYIGLVMEGARRAVMLAILTMMAIGEYHLAYFHPELIAAHEGRLEYTDSLASVLITGYVLFGMVWFVTRTYERESETVLRQSVELEKMNQAQNRFFSNMSHEIRTPINTIIGMNEMILREDISDEVAEDARNIQASSKMLLQLINDVLDMSKIESGKMEIVPTAYNTGAMLSELVGMIWFRAEEKGLAFHVNVDPSLPSVLRGDEVRIKQVLINILNNALKYTQEGSITFSIQYKKTKMGNARVTYTIEDTGVGIRKESIPYLFTAFKRVDAERNKYIEGTGLGLSIVKRFVDLMGGEITVNSIYTKGSTFIVELEQDIDDERAVGILNLDSRHSSKNRRHYKQSFEAPNARILIVDDNETNLIVEEKLLRATKVRVETAESGAEALAKTLTVHYDLILMDHLMPEMDGIECLRELRAQTGGLCRETPVVILTANAGSENQAAYTREGFDGYLAKPVSGETLEAEVLRHLPRELVSKTGNSPSEGGWTASSEEYRKKLPILITTDSVCDLPVRLIERRGIPVLPYHIRTEEGIFLDGVETDTESLLAYMEEHGGNAYSEPPEIAEYETFFADNLARAQHIIHITMTASASGGYANAASAAQSFENVDVVDSGHLSSGLGLIVLFANSIATEDTTARKVIQQIERFRERIHTGVLVDSTEYLARRGRVDSRIHAISRTLMLHPQLLLRDGRLVVSGASFGAQNRSRSRYIAASLRKDEEIDKELLFVTYAGLTDAELGEIAKEIESVMKGREPFEEIIFQRASSTIATNCGPGSFGLLYARKK